MSNEVSGLVRARHPAQGEKDAASYFAESMPEQQLQQLIRGRALELGWLFYHTKDSRRSDGGFPDCVMLRSPRLVIAELKRENGQLTDGQKAWLKAFEETGGETYEWRPSDWYSGVIEEVLR